MSDPETEQMIRAYRCDGLEEEVTELRWYLRSIAQILQVNWSGSVDDRVIESAASSAMQEIERLRESPE